MSQSKLANYVIYGEDEDLPQAQGTIQEVEDLNIDNPQHYYKKEELIECKQEETLTRGPVFHSRCAPCDISHCVSTSNLYRTLEVVRDQLED